MSTVCLVGAGNIARIHAEAIRAAGAHMIACVVDPDEAAARRIAAGAPVYRSVEAALSAGRFERAHVLTPPDLHAPLAETLLRAGRHVLLEKPLATSGADCDRLIEAAVAGGATLGVNQNFVHHPAFAALRATLAAGTLGRLRFASCIYHVPLRQLAARQFGHWMFQAPGNILLEQAVHPLSQLRALAGPFAVVAATAGPALEIAPGTLLVREVDAILRGPTISVQFRQMVGAEYPFWQVTAVCDDGVAVADILANRMTTQTRGGLLEAVDTTLAGLRTSVSLAAGAAGNLIDYARAQAKLGEKKDAFYLSMRGSIEAFHAAVDAGRAPELDGAFGAELVRACEAIRDRCFPVAPPRPAPAIRTERTPDIVLLGGSGFIGTHTVRRLTDAGLVVGVMARSLRALPAVFEQPSVQLFHGDIQDSTAVEAAVGRAPIVVNLAHGGGGATYADIERAMVGGAEAVARVCLAAGVTRLLHIGSIAALYLGDPAETITGATPPDPQDTKRGDYARAKAVADRRLLAMHAELGLKLVLLRPGVVVGEGTSPFHSGVGLFNNDQHCIGWNAGLNPLPFVLASDVAAAIHLAATAPDADGRVFNLVGDIRPTARDYIAALARALQRPLQFHPQRPEQLYAEDIGKWLVKRAAGRNAARPELRDFKSRGMVATFDCADAKQALGWHPVSTLTRFEDEAITIHAGK